MDPADFLPLEELRRRLRTVKEHSQYIFGALPDGHPLNFTLRLVDIQGYIGAGAAVLSKLIPEAPPKRCFRRCGSVHHCTLKPKCRSLDTRPDTHAALTQFFKDWDAGKLYKAKTPEGYRIIARGSTSLAQVAAAPLAPAPTTRQHECRIDLKTLGLQVKRAWP